MLYLARHKSNNFCGDATVQFREVTYERCKKHGAALGYGNADGRNTMGGVTGCSDSSEVEEEEATVNEDGVTVGENITYLFGSAQTEADGVTVVKTDSAYNDETGYGFDFTTFSGGTGTVNANNVSCDKSFQFEMKVENGNYNVTVVTSATTVLSEQLPASFTYKKDANGGTATYTSPNITGVEHTVTANKETTFQVAVCDGVMNLRFCIGSANSVSVSSISYQQFEYNKRDKPYLIAIGDSTTYNYTAGTMCSWGPAISRKLVTLPSEIGGFINCAMGGADAITIYNGGNHKGTPFGVYEALLAVHPGDYVTVNIGINNGATYKLDGIEVSKSDSREAQIPVFENYLVEGVKQRGGIPVIVTITPRGDNSLIYTVATTASENTNAGGKSYAKGVTIPAGSWHNSRHSDTYNKNLLTIAANYDLNVIALGAYGEQYLTDNKITDLLDDVYFHDGGGAAPNHYAEGFGKLFANYVTKSIVEIMNGTYENPYANLYKPIILHSRRRQRSFRGRRRLRLP